MKTKHRPFSLYRKPLGGGRFRYARFRDYTQKRYNTDRALGVSAGGMKERRAEAEKAANDLLPSVTNRPQGMGFIKYLRDFRQPDGRYFREKELSRGKPLTAGYSKASPDLIRLHIEPYPPFKTLALSALTPAVIRDFMAWEAERGVSCDRISRALQVMRAAVRYALDSGDISTDPMRKVRQAYHKAKEKGVLTPQEADRLLTCPSAEQKARYRLAALPGLLGGMRLGEARGLHWEDIDMEAGTLSIRHNWQNMDGLKGPKYDSYRTVPFLPPLSQFIKAVWEKEGRPACGLVFKGQNRGKPCGVTFFRNALIAELEGIGISGEERKRRNLTFHGLRHSFVSPARLSGINGFQIQGLAGHKCASMMDRCSHPGQVVSPRERGVTERYFGNLLKKN